MTNQWEKEKAKIKDDGFTVTVAQAVHKYLTALEDNRKNRHTRWIWELLQNAHDASTIYDKNLIVSIKYSPEELVFLHNGSGFEKEQIQRLIFHGSTKVEDEETKGQYGSGFLTTHLLSSEIDVSGQLDDGQWFDFRLKRKPESVETLRASMNQAWKDFNPSLSLAVPMPSPFTTCFRYPITEDKGIKAAEAGIAALKQCVSYVVAFNEKFVRIDIEDHDEMLYFEVVERLPLDELGTQQITVVESKDGNLKERKYLLAEGDKKTSVTVPFESDGDRLVCLPIEETPLEETPRLFSAFPLVGTETFSFPAVINNWDFKPTEDRDGVYLGQSDNEANRNNQVIIKEACGLLVRLLQFASSKGWHHVHQWMEVAAIQNKDWLNTEWLRTCLRENLIEKIYQTPTVLNPDDNPTQLEKAKLPLAESETSVLALWDLLESMKGLRKILPRREEATGWCNVVKGWADVHQDEPMSLLSEVVDGVKLASSIEANTRKNNTYGKIEDLQNLLREGVSAVEWLNQLHYFLNENELREAVREHYIVVDQSGFLDKLPALHRDLGIDKELKEIAEMLNWPVRQKLRDIRLTSLTDENGYGDMDGNEVVDTLRQKLRDRADENTDDNFKVASTRLFGWIVNQEDWDRLRGFPVFTDDIKSNSLSILHLPSAHTNRPPLAPFCAWTENLKPFSDLFPAERILADAFFEVVLKPDAWKELDNRHLIKSERVIIDGESDDFKFFSPEVYENEDDKKDHEANTPFPTTDVLEWNEIMRNARSNRDNSYLFWRFLTEYLIKEDRLGFEEKEVMCSVCRKTHKYYSAKWLKAVRSNKWIRLGDPHFPAEPSSLANLLRDRWDMSSLNQNPDIGELLKAINVDPSALKRLFISDKVINIASTLSESPQLARHMEDNEKRHQIEQILDTVGDNLPLVNEAVQDKKFLEEYEKKKGQDLTIQANKSLGLLVEEMVGQILDEKKFKVKSNHRGWDFDMTGHITELEVVQNNSSKTWRVEVKTTRTEDNHQGIRMSFPQAQEAVKHGKEYLLCVVPLGQEDATPENVRKKMLFIEDIGDRVKPLYKKLDKLKKMRDGIIDDDTTDLQLIVEEGKSGVLVKRPIWEAKGFPLTNLVERLK